MVAVASIGFLMLTGRIEPRRAGRVVLDCFILFGASAIAAGICTRSGSSAADQDGPRLKSPPSAGA